MLLFVKQFCTSGIFFGTTFSVRDRYDMRNTLGILYFSDFQYLETVEDGNEINFCEKELSKMNTITGKNILKEKRDFINIIIKQLKLELSGTIEYEGKL
jgi:hypothetical protein